MIRTALSRRLTAIALVVVASLGLQSGAISVDGLLGRLGPTGVSGLRFALAAVLLLLLVRPRLAGRSRTEWLAIGCFGISMAGMNAFLTNALAHLPLGIAITIDFLGPFAVAIAGIRRPVHALFPVLGLVGIALVVRPSGEWDAVGLMWAGLSAATFAAYTVLSARVGGSGPGFDGLALAVTVAAVALAPAALASAPRLVLADALPLTVSAVLGVCVTFAADLSAIRLAGTRAVAVLFSLDPIMAALLGAMFLHDVLDATTVIGIVLVAAAGAGALWCGSEPSPRTVGTAHDGVGRRGIRVSRRASRSSTRAGAQEATRVSRRASRSSTRTGGASTRTGDAEPPRLVSPAGRFAVAPGPRGTPHGPGGLSRPRRA